MKLKHLFEESLRTNTYLIMDEKETVIIDPVFSIPSVTKVLVTHGHYDHIRNLKYYQNRGIPIYISKNDAPLLFDPELNASIYFDEHFVLDNLENIHFLEEEKNLVFNILVFSVFNVPGHTLGSVMFKIEENLFTGDFIFKNTIGRTDLKNSNLKLMKESLLKLTLLPKKLKVYPGHGEFTTLEDELKNNPFIRHYLRK